MRGLVLLLVLGFGIFKLVRWWLARVEAGQAEARAQLPAWSEPGPSESEPLGPPLLAVPSRDRLALAVEASQTMAKALDLVLGPEGFALRVVETPDEIERALSEARPDVILLDPDLLGGEARARMARRLKQDGRLQGVPVVLVGESSENLWPLEPVAQVTRPYDSQELLDAVALALRAPATAARAVEPAPCPVCGHPVEGPPAVCPRCGRGHHHECYQLNDGCGACPHATT